MTKTLKELQEETGKEFDSNFSHITESPRQGLKNAISIIQNK